MEFPFCDDRKIALLVVQVPGIKTTLNNEREWKSTWKSVKPPLIPDPVAATSSGTGRSSKEIRWLVKSGTTATVMEIEKGLTPFFASENVMLAIGP